MKGGVSKPKSFIENDRSLTDTELVKCATFVVARLKSGKCTMVRMVEREDLFGMALEAVVLADRSYKPMVSTREFWVITKGQFLVMDMLRAEARHTVCLSVTEFRGSTRDAMGNPVKARVKVPLNEEPVGDIEGSSPVAYLKSTSPSPWTIVHNRHLRERLEDALQKLPDQRAATAFRLVVWHDWKQADVGALFGVTPARISQMLTRARAYLQVDFDDLTFEQRAA